MTTTTLERTAPVGAVVGRLSPADLPEMVRLAAEVAADSPAGYLRARTLEELAGYLDGRLGAAYGVRDPSGLVGFSLLHFPSQERPNPTPQIPLIPEADWPLHACFLATSMVARRARGRGHHRAMVTARLGHASATHMRWACAGSHFANVASWRNLLERGLVIAGVRLDFGPPVIGLIRPLRAFTLATDPQDQRQVPATDALAHQAALDAGYAGVRLGSDGVVTYQRVI